MEARRLRGDFMATDTIERPATPHEIVERAITARCYIKEALAQLDAMPPHPERTRVGRMLLDAHYAFGEWMGAGGYLGGVDDG
jgi:hypothetical protein